MTGHVIDGQKIKDTSDLHDKYPERFHAEMRKRGRKTCTLCGHLVDKIRMTRKTVMRIVISSRMTESVRIETAKGDKAWGKEFQKQLHNGIAYAIMGAVENARDDNDFDRTALDAINIALEDCDRNPEISDFAEIRLEYSHGGKLWLGERVMTKAERENKDRRLEIVGRCTRCGKRRKISFVCLRQVFDYKRYTKYGFQLCKPCADEKRCGHSECTQNWREGLNEK